MKQAALDRSRLTVRALIGVACLGGLLTACGEDASYRDKVYGANSGPARPGDRDAGGADDVDAGPTKSAKACEPAVADPSEQLPARDAVMSDEVAGDSSSDQGVFTQALFDEFLQHCGSCHSGTTSQGGLSANAGNFRTKIGADALARIKSEASGVGGFMPPSPDGMPFSKRPAEDTIRAFASRLEQWIQQGRPADVFFPKGKSASASGGKGLYLLRKQVGMQLTNLGNCIPSPAIMATDQSGMGDLDDKFAAMKSYQDLPKSLAETDLTSFDAEVLAKQGLVAFAPAYTLWADNAKKMRVVRVPRGQSIRFDSDTQSFDIPANTRFYKTFFKATIDLNGQTRYRKMESRIILSRPARQRDDGTYEQTAIFGTYKWNEAETEATLQNRPYRDGEGFRDEVFPYVVDERKDDEVLRKGPKDQLAARLAAGAMRNYAIPGFDRCMHCHMGAPNQSFILGFTPLQIHRRPMGEGGVQDPVAEDELNQIQRLIDYGVITGLGSADDITPLEKSQGDREPRNDRELNAQAYMLGNCAHCHNPNGFPSLKEPSLRDVLNFLPGSPGGGIFQFPLEKFSPRKFVGDKADVKLPYITPSLFDFPPEALGYGSWQDGRIVAKWVTNDAPDFEYWSNGPAVKYSAPSTFEDGWPLLAPWRSVIYRNVDAPFTYQEANAVFPHMPMDTPGYDCRARTLLGAWMTSIPARWKQDGEKRKWKTNQLVDWIDSDTLLPIIDPATGQPKKVYKIDVDVSGVLTGDGISLDEFFWDLESQPYIEVTPDDAHYGIEAFNAENRAQRFLDNARAKDCPNTDILDPVVTAAGIGVPTPATVKGSGDPTSAKSGHYQIAAPAQPHYFQTDLRPDKYWVIRRGDWFNVLVPGAPDNDTNPYNNDPYLGEADQQAWKVKRDILLQRRLSDALRKAALEEVPFGLWQDKPECSAKYAAAGVKKAADYQGSARPDWMTFAPNLAAEAPIYALTRGGAVFETICSKCHGPQGDGQSSLASTMADMTGGLTRVANLRDGIFGPPGNPGKNRLDPVVGFGRSPQELGTLNGVQLTPDDWAARYAAWMGLGGTRASIPVSIVASIGVTEILGVRSGVKLEAVTGQEAANMLEIARLSCRAVAPNDAAKKLDQGLLFDPARGELIADPDLDGKPVETHSIRTLQNDLWDGSDLNITPSDWYPRPTYLFALGKTGLITTNGHAALWQRLCAVDNPMPIRIVRFDVGTHNKLKQDGFYVSQLYRRSEYPQGVAIGDGDGQTRPSLDDSNLSPWCVVRPPVLTIQKRVDKSQVRTESVLVDHFDEYQRRTGKTLPLCPDQVAADNAPGLILTTDTPPRKDPEVEDWALRGAMNAGMSVFLYLDALSKGTVKPVPAYTRCEELAR